VNYPALDAGRLPDAPEPLDLHEGLSGTEESRALRPATCARWPQGLRLHGAGGRLVKGRCRATNLCDYCARLAAVEWSEMLAIDAMEGEAPQVYAVLTTRSTSPAPEDFYEARRAVLDALRAEFPGVRYCAIVEFTTGRGLKSRGSRRPHWNLIFKGIPAESVARARAIIRRTWCANADAVPAAQYVGKIAHHGGLMRYLALHFQKEAQRPPADWRHKQRVTFSTTRNKAGGYFNRPVWQVRRDAQRGLRTKRELWKLEREGVVGNAAAIVADVRVLRAESVRWELVHITVDEAGELVKVTPAFNRRYPFGSRITGRDLRLLEVQERAVTGALEALRQHELAGLAAIPRARAQLAMTGAAFRSGG
jgi:hypothetical protein